VLRGVVGALVRKAQATKQPPNEIVVLVEQALEPRAIAIGARRSRG
jgi:hypothetical protein